MRNATFLRKMLWLLCLPLLFIACKDNMDEHYEVPDWVADNAWEVLVNTETIPSSYKEWRLPVSSKCLKVKQS